MEVLAADPAGRERANAVHTTVAGTPGSFCSNSGACVMNSKSSAIQEMAVVEAVFALFVAGISPIRVEQGTRFGQFGIRCQS